MDKSLLKVLKKLYLHSNYDYDSERGVSRYRVDTLTPPEQGLLKSSGWEPNELEHITHDGVNRELLALQKNEHLSWSSITDAFVAGVGGSQPRGISPLMSYHLMIHTKEHAYEQAERFICCKDCGLHKDQWDNLSYIRYAVHLGNYYGTTSEGAYVDLKEFADILKQQPLTPTAEDITIFKQLLHSLDQAADVETPGQYEKRLTSEKLVKGTAGIRRGILQSLGRVGVLPNRVLPLSFDTWTNIEDLLNGELELNNTKGRSDMSMPWAGWQGNLGVDWDKARQLFGAYLE
ncbi:hypothetical protein GCM10010912_52860 [Paenibacillus albidus]|uniref:Uncharacterized protein n=1 Tax=Paenibacillus albidus TaxID=2041023 RepID=A0A917CYB2_9BACL|nr:hypothetical protein [Paenibacillus albidus]GGG01413.1 hypothetical protein GCM10010912_52860 [Paenibacillus albidus]